MVMNALCLKLNHIFQIDIAVTVGDSGCISGVRHISQPYPRLISDILLNVVNAVTSLSFGVECFLISIG
jgi:hypothetical protein